MSYVERILLNWFCFLFSMALSTIGLFMTWNQIIPQMFGLMRIDLLQALCLCWVSHSLFKPYILFQKDKKAA